MNGAAGESAVAGLAPALAASGWAVDAAFAPGSLVADLRARVLELERGGAFRAAAVGAGAQRAVRPAVRGDRLCWLDGAATPAEATLLANFEALRSTLNRELQLGLTDFECHYAQYAPGAAYVRHLDRSPAGAERVISAVLYLNDDWSEADAGQLWLHAAAGRVALLPQAGTLVLFESARLEHEVRPARRDRLSIAGWFRRRSALLG
jgi:SM-20-related protein